MDYQNLQENHTKFHSSLEIKRNLIEELEYNLGFGGFIHQFKNYILRFEQHNYQEIVTSLSKIDDLCKEYNSLTLLPEEKNALQNIKRVLEQYRHSLAIAHNYFQKTKTFSVQKLDTLVRVDDTPLINGISSLKQIVSKNNKKLSYSGEQIMTELLESISLLIILVLPLLVLVWLLVNRFISFKTKQLDHELSINEKLLEELNLSVSAFETHEAILVANSDNVIIKVNKSFCLLTGYEEQEVIGKTPKLIQSGLQSLKFYAELWNALNTKGSWSGEIIDRKKNGDHFIAWLSICSIRNKQGEVEYYLAHFTDITDYKNTNAAFNRRLKIEEMISDVSIRMLKAKTEEFDHAVNNCLKLLTGELDSDRSYLFSISSDSLFMSNTHEWCVEEVEPMIDSLQKMEINKYSWTMNQLFNKKVVQIYDVDALPVEARAEQQELKRHSIQSVLLIPITDGKKLTGFFGFDRVKQKRAWRDEDVSLFKMIADVFYSAQYRHQIEDLNSKHLEKTVQLLVENQTLLTENRELTSRTIQTLENERHILSQELHDELGQQITAIRMDVAYLKALPSLQTDEQVLQTIKSIDYLSTTVINKLRLTIQRIRSATLDHLGLVPALKELVENWTIHNRAITVDTELSEGLDKLDEDITITLYRAVQEALTNISKHAKANHVKITLKQDLVDTEQFIKLTISDDGVGINLQNEFKEGFGLLGMKERVRALNGKLQISQDKNGCGTCLKISIPLINCRV